MTGTPQPTGRFGIRVALRDAFVRWTDYCIWRFTFWARTGPGKSGPAWAHLNLGRLYIAWPWPFQRKFEVRGG